MTPNETRNKKTVNISETMIRLNKEYGVYIDIKFELYDGCVSECEMPNIVSQF